MYGRLRRFAVFIVMLSLLIVGMAAPASAQDNSLRVGINAPDDLDPHTASTDSAVLLNRSIYDYLIETLPDGSLAPNLASSWEISDDGLTYTFHLVDGVTFHDGSPLTAADVVYSFNRIKELQSPPTALMGTDFEVTAADDQTVVFTLPEIRADFLYGISDNLGFIIKDGTENPNQLGEGDSMFANFNGTGPFVITDFKPGQSVTLTKNENYWIDGEPKLDTLEFDYFDDTTAQINAVLNGEIDVIFRIPLDQLFQFDSSDTVSLVHTPSNIHPVVRLRADAGHLGEDVRIRQAFKLATDREQINQDLLDGLGAVGQDNPIGPFYADYYAADMPAPAHDPAQACTLIKEATGQDRLSATLYAVDSFNYAQLAQILQQQWQEGCIDVDIMVRPEAIYYSGETNEWLEVDLGITGWGHRAIPQSLLQQAYVTDGVYNESHWSNADIDALVAEASQTVDVNQRKEIYHQIAEIFADQGPIIIPFFLPLFSAANNRVQDLTVNPFPGRTDFRSVSVS